LAFFIFAASLSSLMTRLGFSWMGPVLQPKEPQTYLNGGRSGWKKTSKYAVFRKKFLGHPLTREGKRQKYCVIGKDALTMKFKAGGSPDYGLGASFGSLPSC